MWPHLLYLNVPRDFEHLYLSRGVVQVLHAHLRLALHPLQLDDAFTEFLGFHHGEDLLFSELANHAVKFLDHASMDQDRTGKVVHGHQHVHLNLGFVIDDEQ